MKKYMNFLGVGIAFIAMAVSTAASNQVCAFLIGQPELPEKVKSLRKF